MSAVLLGTFPPNTPEWHELRAGGIGGSEIAAVVGLSPYDSAFWLWHHKKGNLPGKDVTDAMDWGNRLEPVVRRWFAERHPELCIAATPGTYAHGERPWQRVNPDGFIYEHATTCTCDDVGGGCAKDVPTALLEVKTSRFPDGWGTPGTDEIPLMYACQVQHALDVFGLDRAYVAVLIGGNEPREYVIEADAEDQATLRAAGEQFWQSLQTDNEPPIDCSDSTYEAVRRLYPGIDPDEVVELNAIKWHEYLQLRQSADAAAEGLQRVKSELLAAMGTARIGTYQDVPVLRRQMSSTTTPYLKEIA